MAPKIPTNKINLPLNILKVNIGTKDQPKFANIRDYWDEETMEKIIDLLHEFQDLFPTFFSKMKGILGYFREMKVPLNPDEFSATTFVSSESMIQGKSKG